MYNGISAYLEAATELDRQGAEDMNEIRECFCGVTFGYSAIANAPAQPLRERLSYLISDSESALSACPGMKGAIISISDKIESIRKDCLRQAGAFDGTFTGSLAALDSSRQTNYIRPLQEASNSVTTLININTIIPGLLSPHNELASKFLQQIKAVAKESEASWLTKKSIKSQLKTIIQKRRSLQKSRDAFLASTQGVIEVTTKSFEIMQSTILERSSMLAELLKWVPFAQQEFAKDLRASSQALKVASEQINFQSDLSEFYKKKHLLRYDLELTIFKPITTSFDQGQIEIPTAPFLPFIYGVASIVCNFKADGKNEIDTKAGSQVLMMEANDTDWCLIMNPKTRATGYVPSKFLKQIGFGVGIVKASPSEKFLKVSVGEVVAIMSESSKSEALSVENLSGASGQLPYGSLAIISSAR